MPLVKLSSKVGPHYAVNLSRAALTHFSWTFGRGRDTNLMTADWSILTTTPVPVEFILFVTQPGHLLPCYKGVTSLDKADQGWGAAPVHTCAFPPWAGSHPSLSLPTPSSQTICEQKGITMTQLLTHGKLSAIMNYSFRLQTPHLNVWIFSLSC